MNRDKILDDLEEIQDKVERMGFKGQNEYSLALREEIADYIEQQTKTEALNITDVSNFVLLLKPNYKAKDGTIKGGIKINGKYYAPQNDY